jgi:hypothetical protein
MPPAGADVRAAHQTSGERIRRAPANRPNPTGAHGKQLPETMPTPPANTAAGANPMTLGFDPRLHTVPTAFFHQGQPQQNPQQQQLQQQQLQQQQMLAAAAAAAHAAQVQQQQQTAAIAAALHSAGVSGLMGGGVTPMGQQQGSEQAAILSQLAAMAAANPNVLAAIRSIAMGSMMPAPNSSADPLAGGTSPFGHPFTTGMQHPQYLPPPGNGTTVPMPPFASQYYGQPNNASLPYPPVQVPQAQQHLLYRQHPHYGFTQASPSSLSSTSDRPAAIPPHLAAAALAQPRSTSLTSSVDDASPKVHQAPTHTDSDWRSPTSSTTAKRPAGISIQVPAAYLAPPTAHNTPSTIGASMAIQTPGGTEPKPILAERFKTKMCQNYERTGSCRYEARCMFAHGHTDLRTKDMNLRDNLTSEEAIRVFQRTGDTSELQSRSAVGPEMLLASKSVDTAVVKVHVVGTVNGAAAAKPAGDTATVTPNPMVSLSSRACNSPAGDGSNSRVMVKSFERSAASTRAPSPAANRVTPPPPPEGPDGAATGTTTTTDDNVVDPEEGPKKKKPISDVRKAYLKAKKKRKLKRRAQRRFEEAQALRNGEAPRLGRQGAMDGGDLSSADSSDSDSDGGSSAELAAPPPPRAATGAKLSTQQPVRRDADADSDIYSDAGGDLPEALGDAIGGGGEMAMAEASVEAVNFSPNVSPALGSAAAAARPAQTLRQFAASPGLQQLQHSAQPIRSPECPHAPPLPQYQPHPNLGGSQVHHHQTQAAAIGPLGRSMNALNRSLNRSNLNAHNPEHSMSAHDLQSCGPYQHDPYHRAALERSNQQLQVTQTHHQPSSAGDRRSSIVHRTPPASSATITSVGTTLTVASTGTTGTSNEPSLLMGPPTIAEALRADDRSYSDDGHGVMAPLLQAHHAVHGARHGANPQGSYASAAAENRAESPSSLQGNLAWRVAPRQHHLMPSVSPTSELTSVLTHPQQQQGPVLTSYSAPGTAALPSPRASQQHATFSLQPYASSTAFDSEMTHNLRSAPSFTFGSSDFVEACGNVLPGYMPHPSAASFQPHSSHLHHHQHHAQQHQPYTQGRKTTGHHHFEDGLDFSGLHSNPPSFIGPQVEAMGAGHGQQQSPAGASRGIPAGGSACQSPAGAHRIKPRATSPSVVALAMSRLSPNTLAERAAAAAAAEELQQQQSAFGGHGRQPSYAHEQDPMALSINSTHRGGGGSGFYAQQVGDDGQHYQQPQQLRLMYSPSAYQQLQQQSPHYGGNLVPDHDSIQQQQESAAAQLHARGANAGRLESQPAIGGHSHDAMQQSGLLLPGANRLDRHSVYLPEASDALLNSSYNRGNPPPASSFQRDSEYSPAHHQQHHQQHHQHSQSSYHAASGTAALLGGHEASLMPQHQQQQLCYQGRGPIGGGSYPHLSGIVDGYECAGGAPHGPQIGGGSYHGDARSFQDHSRTSPALQQ